MLRAVYPPQLMPLRHRVHGDQLPVPGEGDEPPALMAQGAPVPLGEIVPDVRRDLAGHHSVPAGDMEIEVAGGASAGVAVLLGVDPGLFGPDRLPSGGVLKVVQMEDDQTEYCGRKG